MSVTLKIHGFKELQSKINKLPGRVQKNVLRASLRAGGRETVKAARAKLPPNYVILRKSLTVKILCVVNPREMRALIGPTVGKSARYDGWYAHIVERGAAPHDIGLKTKKAFQLSGDLKVVAGGAGTPGVIRHPGVPAHPFLGPALRNNQQQILKAMAERMRAGIEKAAR